MGALKKLVIDARAAEGVGGFARYVGLMIDGLSALKDQQVLEYEIILLTGARPRESAFRTRRVRSSFLAPSELIEIPILLRSLGAHAYHSPTFSSLLPLSMPCPWISTIHDLNHLQFGDLSKKLYYRTLLRSFACQAAALLTVSEFSRQEIARWLEIDPARIGLARNAIAPEFFAPPIARGRYFYCLSNSKPHKNVQMLREAYGRFAAGRSDADPLEVSFDRGPISNAEAASKVATATAVFFPSLYEGFGLPPIEAAAQGVPIVVSDIPPHREGLACLAADEVHWCDPRSVEDWVRAFDLAQRGGLKSPSVASRARLRETYSVENLARAMDRVYRAVLTQKT